MAIKYFVALNRKAATWLEAHLPAVFGAPEYVEELQRRITADINDLKPDTILEVGGIDRPLLSQKANYQYIGLDIEERPDCHKVYDRFIVQSIEEPVGETADMVISTTLLEHVPNNKAAVRSMFEALAPGGTTHHYLPSKWHLYSISLRLIGPTLQRRLIPILRPTAVETTGYPAYFDRCSPSSMATLFRESGFEQINVRLFPTVQAIILPFFLRPSGCLIFESFCAFIC